MDLDGFGKLLAAIIGSTMFVLVVAVFINAIANLGLAPKPGDPFYPLWLSNLNLMDDILPKMVTGVGVVGVWLLYQLRSGF